MSGYFTRPSLAINLYYEYVPFSDDCLRIPAKIGTQLARAYIHEVLHFWQTLSLGFVTNLALQECIALEEFEAGRRSTRWTELMESFDAVDNRVGFSARQLTEALARFWDIHICGPARLLRQHREWRAQQEAVGLPRQHAVRLPADELLEREDEAISLTDKQRIKVKKYTSFAFDALMLLEDDYAIPYRLLLKQAGSRLAVILFPIIAYFSLQTRFPLRVYEAALNEVRDKVRLPQNVLDIHQGWRHVFQALGEWCFLLAVAKGGSALTPGWDVISGSQLREHPIFGHYLQVLDFTSHLLKTPCNFHFALPGDPIARSFLAEYFPPPLVLLGRGNWILESPLQQNLAALAAGDALYYQGERFDASRFPGIKLDRVRSPCVLAEAAIDLDRRFRAMQISYITRRVHPDQSSTDRRD